MRKLFFFDIDGTLTSAKVRNYVPDSTWEALRLLKENGHFVALATGRPEFRAREFQEIIKIPNMVCEGGNHLIMDYKTVWSEPLDQQVVRKIYKEAMEKGIGIAVATEDNRIRYTPNRLFEEKIGDYDQDFMVIKVDEQLDLEKRPPVKRLLIGLELHELDRLESIREIGVMHYRDNRYVLIEPDDKYKGIKRMVDLMNEDETNIIVFGDGLNDRKMFQDAAFSIAMGNAVDELKELADYVTDTSDHDGIYKACKHFGWI